MKNPEEGTAKTEKEEIIEDIIANNAVEAPQSEEAKMMFTKAKVIDDEIEFSLWNVDGYLHFKYRYVPSTVRKLIEILIVTILFMGIPVALAFLERGKKALYIFPQILRNKGSGTLHLFVKINLFLTLCHVIYVLVSIFADNILYLIITVLRWMNIEPNEYIIETIQVINSTSWCWKQALASILIFCVATLISQPYSFGKNDGSYRYIAITLIMMYSLFMTIIFAEKFVMCFLISEIRRKEYRNRIWDINYKTFIFKKLAAVSEASPSERRELSETMETDFDPGFYLKYNDLKLNSVEAAETVAESIFGFLEIQELIYEDIKKFFPQNHDEVYAYLSENYKASDGNRPSISFQELKIRAVTLYRERADISRTLQSRDIIINKLDIILLSLSMYFGAILVMILLGVDYKLFLASVGPSVVAFGWIFSDTIKEIYNCFIFLLVNHPYDFGDKVVIDGEELYVSAVDLLSSTFVGVNGRQVFIPTNYLFHRKIYNIRRSGKQFEVVGILLNKTTTFDGVLELKDRVSKMLAASNKSFSGEMYLKDFKAEGDNVKISFAIQHQSNFQDVKKRENRRVEFINILENEMKALRITHLNSYVFSD